MTADTAGTMRLGGPELVSMSLDNTYEPAWILLSELDSTNLQPVEIRSLLKLSTRHPDPLKVA